MTNLDYLADCKKARDKLTVDMEDLIKTEGSNPELEKLKLEARKMHALEIIAEEFCKLNELFVKVKSMGLKIKK